MKFNVSIEEFKKAVSSQEQKDWFRNELNKFDKNISKIKIRNDVDQALAHKYDSPNKDQLKGNEIGYYVLDDSKQQSIDYCDSKWYFLNKDGEMIEITPTGMERTSMSWNEIKEDD